MQESNNTPVQEQKGKKNTKVILLVIGILLLISFLSIGTIVFYFLHFDNQAQEEQTVLENEDDLVVDLDDIIEYPMHILATELDVTAFTDIVLSDYDGLYVDIFEGLPNTDEEYLGIPGIVHYFQRTHADNDEAPTVLEKEYGYKMDMKIVNIDSAKEEFHEERFESAILEIENKSLEREALLSTFRMGMGGGIQTIPVKSIEGVEYDNTDRVFSFLSVVYTQETPGTRLDDIEGPSFTISVYAIKDNNIIFLDLYGVDVSTLGVSENDLVNCFGEEVGPNYTYYDMDCVIELLEDDVYTASITQVANELVSRFEIEE